MSKRKTGFVKWFDYRKGYGFITTDELEEVFVHFSNIDMEGFKKLDMGDHVEFELQESKDGKGSEALNVKVILKDKRYF